MTYINPKTIIVDFLRNNITDPRGRITSNSNSYTATSGQTSFSITPTTGKSMSHITSVTVDLTEITKWEEYYIDAKNEKVILFSGLTVGQKVKITFGEGSTNWIYPDKPNEKLTSISFPRMNVITVSNPGKRLGNYEAPVESTARFQIDIWTKEKQDNQIFTIDSNVYTGNDLAEYLSLKTTEAFEDNESELFPVLYGYEPTAMGPDIPFNSELQCHHKTVEFFLKCLNMGRIN